LATSSSRLFFGESFIPSGSDEDDLDEEDELDEDDDEEDEEDEHEDDDSATTG
jgi:hypothetical protein